MILYFQGIVMRVKIILAVTLLVLGQIACSYNKKPTDLNLHIVVRGRVVDSADRPVPGAKVQARLGLDLDGTIVETGSDGRFVAEAASDFWFKGCPSINAQAKDFAEEYIYFDCWDRGERQFERTVKLKPEN
jgi:hypothetical protein